jgi:hypothetical protein
MESSCELGNEPSGSIKCWELPNGCTSCGMSSGTQLHIISFINMKNVVFLDVTQCCSYKNNVSEEHHPIMRAKRINELRTT